jgi:energy-coupling factor transport system substrate-specific component
VPYLVWEALTDRAPVPETPGASAGLVAVMVLAATLCATVVGWGIQILGFHPFTTLATFVLLNNVLVAVLLGPFLLSLLYPRIRRARLLYRDLLGPRARVPAWRAVLGTVLLAAGTLGAFVAGQLIASGGWQPPWTLCETASGACEVGFGLLPLLALAVGGLALL